MCNTCTKLYSLGSLEPKKQTVHGLKQHLSKFHDSEYRQLLKRQSELDEQKEEIKLRRTERLSMIDTATETQNLLQTTIPDFKTRAAKLSTWPDDHEISRRIDKAIMNLIIVDMLPYALVEGKAFKRLNFADSDAIQKYKLKSEKYFRTTLTPQTYEKVKSKVMNIVQKCDWLSATCDIWTNPTKTCSLLSFTAHFIQGPQRLKVILGATVLDEDHTSQYIEQKLTAIVPNGTLGINFF